MVTGIGERKNITNTTHGRETNLSLNSVLINDSRPGPIGNFISTTVGKTADWNVAGETVVDDR